MNAAVECAPPFLELLEPFDLGELQRDEDVVFGLWGDLTLAYVNPAWRRFATDNGGWDVPERFPLGSSLLSAIQGDVLPFYEDALRGVLDANRPWEHDYECSSPTVARWFRMRVLPLEGRGLLVSNALLIQRAHAPGERPPLPADDAVYRDARGLLVQCCGCRRTRRAGINRWDWVPEYVARCPPRTSHGICPLCMGHYYPQRPRTEP